MNKKNQNFLSEFILKIIGYITMTFDHVGIFLESINGQQNLAYIFRCIGRIAFPLFVFMIVEGIIHTSNVKNYLKRLGILALILIVSSFAIEIILGGGFALSSPITDLFFIALAIYLINRKDKFSFLSLLPIGYIILCFVVKTIEFSTSKNLTFLPVPLRCDYTIIGLILALGFYYSKPLAKVIIKNSGSATENLVDTPYERYVENAVNTFVVLLVVFAFYLIILLDH